MKVSHKIKQRKQIKKTTAQESDTTDLENDPERVYFEKVYDLLIAQNKLDNPCFDYQYDAKGYPYAVVSTNDEYTLSLVFNKYKIMMKIMKLF